MPESLARFIAGALVLVHAGLGAWALIGVLELALPEVPWRRISNPAFSSAMLALQWALVATAASVFIAGSLRRWSHTPVAMLLVYGAMASVCAWQTFFILTNPSRFRAMAIEYVEYVAILSFLFLSSHMRRHFRRDLPSDPARRSGDRR
jgi:hypothetical protein